MNLMDLKYKIRRSLTSNDYHELAYYRNVLIEYSLKVYQKEDWDSLHEICALLGEIDAFLLLRLRESSSASGG